MKLSFSEIQDLLRQSLKPPAGESCVYLVETYPERVVYELDDKCFQRSYAIVDGKVTLGDEVPVKKSVDYLPLQAAGQLLAAVGDSGGDDYGYTWRVQVVEYGLGKDGRINWPAGPLQAAIPLYEGARVFALNDSQHVETPKAFGKSVREIVGWVENVRDTGTGLEGDFQILKSAKWLRDMVVDGFERGKTDIVGLSHDVRAKAKTVMVAGKKVKEPVRIESVQVDVVYDPTNNGKFISMVAAVKAGLKDKEENMTVEQLLAALKSAKPEAYNSLKGKIDDKSVTAEEVLVMLAAQEEKGVDKEALKAAVASVLSGMGIAPAGGKDGGEEDSDPLRAAQKALDSARLVAAGVTLKYELAESGLPVLSQKRLGKQFEAKVFESAELQAAIKDEKEYLDQLTSSGRVTGAGGAIITVDSHDKAVAMIDDFFDGKVSSFKAAYVNLTGDSLVTGDLKAASRLTAAIDSTTFAEVLGDAVARKMVKEYKGSGLQDWRKICDVVPLADFRTNHRTRMGGYGDLPDVAQGDPYTALTTPGDEEATYSAGKKGGTEDITLEAIKNDDAGAIKKIPVKLSRAAARTLYKFVFNSLLANNPTIYDAKALFHAGHGNLGSAALDAAALTARRQAMLKQQEAGSSEPLGIPAKYLIHPIDLDKVAYDLVAAPRNSDFDPTSADFTRTLQMETISVPFWTDADNWFLMADPSDIVCIEIGFLDGKEEPELFIQDMPNVGSMFSNDKLTYKIRHIYGGGITDFRGADGSVVAA